MYQIRSKQITRLEKRARPYFEQRAGMAQRWGKIRHGAVTHAAVLAFLLRYGEPRIEEPLSEAFKRASESGRLKVISRNNATEAKIRRI